MPIDPRFFLATTALTVLYCPLLASGDLNVTDSEFEKIEAEFCSLLKTTVCCGKSKSESMQTFCLDPRLKVHCLPPYLEEVQKYLDTQPIAAGGLNVTDSEFEKISGQVGKIANGKTVCCGKSESESIRAFCDDPRLPRPFCPPPGMGLGNFATLFVNLDAVETIFKRKKNIETNVETK
ncbi:hypothetical protein DdX_19116 [Ditylenchus destructor]|uniref:Uncharacterized protein n=1 Tax=Ditylenchus destructor TaxID=166010 RepID=A0AAD4QUE3_9BILA|nr:hypothetical protein DdX_19116 [Ditylenchus destructor]